MTQGQEKLQHLLRYLGCNIPSLAACLAVEKQRFYDIQSGKTKKFSFELASAIHDAYDEVSLDWILGKSDIMIRPSSGVSEGNPFFENFTAQGGTGHGNGDEKALMPDGYMSVPGIQVSNEIPFIQVRGKSMINTREPEHSIPPGSWIAVKRVLGRSIRWGEVYAIETVDGPIVKRLMPSKKENCVRCESFNEDYPPFELPITDIVDDGFYIVKGVVNVQIWN